MIYYKNVYVRLFCKYYVLVSAAMHMGITLEGLFNNWETHGWRNYVLFGINLQVSGTLGLQDSVPILTNT